MPFAAVPKLTWTPSNPISRATSNAATSAILPRDQSTRPISNPRCAACAKRGDRAGYAAAKPTHVAVRRTNSRREGRPEENPGVLTRRSRAQTTDLRQPPATPPRPRTHRPGLRYTKISPDGVYWGEVEPDGSAEPQWAARLYDACATELILYGRALGLSHGEAEDVLHDAFKALLLLAEPPREPRFDPVRTFRNRTLNHRRSLWRRLTRELESSRWFEAQEGESAIERDAVAALSRLPAEQREAIVLKIGTK